MDTYYFWVEETDAHDRELATYEANSLEEAREMFEADHAEDINHIESISIENQLMPLWQKGEL